ncbi:MAG: chitobiase/beta-hexosaminidase C-terminal domain-containing protein [Clostridium sp.]|nr:chitobiase/beta-hexosaminidase C-terminal domain-containing protein [Prevotella sp.]MCM1428755.1 chitobiase/beta-hexosaminidase C-terminal domain-containing protein [Clostridium sp.]
MKHFFLLLFMMTTLAGISAEKSFSIEFGAEAANSNSLETSNFMTAVKSGGSYISDVSSVISVFPELDAIKLSSAKKTGEFNLHLSSEAQIAASKFEIVAYRFDNDRDAEATLSINAESVAIPSLTPETYTIEIPSRPLPILENIVVKADKRLYIQSITIFYDDANGEVPEEKAQVLEPVFLPGTGTVTAGTAVQISCDTPDAVIYYTIDGSEPTTLSTVYSAPVVINEDITLQAFAAKEGMLDSEVVQATYRVVNVDPDMAMVFDFANPESLNPSVAAPAQKESVLLDGRTFTNCDVAVSFVASQQGNTHVRLYGSYDAGCDLRIYDGEQMIVRSFNPAVKLSQITFDISESGTSDVTFDANVGEYTWEDTTWYAGEESVEEVVLTSMQQSRISKMTVAVKTDSDSSAVETVEIYGTEGTYYDLQGRKLSGRPTIPGIYIKVTLVEPRKVMIK